MYFNLNVSIIKPKQYGPKVLEIQYCKQTSSSMKLYENIKDIHWLLIIHFQSVAQLITITKIRKILISPLKLFEIVRNFTWTIMLNLCWDNCISLNKRSLLINFKIFTLHYRFNNDWHNDSPIIRKDCFQHQNLVVSSLHALVWTSNT